jgi:hypothetical protein
MNVFFAGLLALTLAAPAVQDTPRYLKGAEREAFFDQLEARMAARKTVVAEFEQEKVLALFDDPLRSSGMILFEAPSSAEHSGGKLRWEIRTPFRSLLIVAEEDVAKFEYTSAGARRALTLGRAKDPLLAVMDQIRGWFRGRFDRGETLYRLRVAREPEAAIVLEPREAALKKSLQAIEVRLTEALDGVRSVTLREVNGDRTTMVFQERKWEGALDKGYFDLRDPKELELEALGRGNGK